MRSAKVKKSLKASLKAELSEGRRTFTNQWDFWLFPEQVELTGPLVIYGEPKYTWLRTVKGLPMASSSDLAGDRVRAILTERLDEPAVTFARMGGKVIVAADEGLVRQFGPLLTHAYGRYFFTRPANYPPFEDGHDGTIILSHPMLGNTPHDGFADLQFFRMLAEAPPLELESLGLNGADPVIRVMHSYPVGRSLGYLTEASLGRGGLILSSLNLNTSWIEARYLLAQICSYAVGGDFAPAIALDEDALAAIVSGTSLP